MVAVTVHIDFFLKEFEFKTKFLFIYLFCVLCVSPHGHTFART